MLTPKPSKKFEKSLQRMQKRGKDLKKIREVIDHLVEQRSLPYKHREHKLSGDWESFWECHIEPDWLLIYRFAYPYLELAETGTHSDLF